MQCKIRLQALHELEISVPYATVTDTPTFSADQYVTKQYCITSTTAHRNIIFCHCNIIYQKYVDYI